MKMFLLTFLAFSFAVSPVVHGQVKLSDKNSDRHDQRTELIKFYKSHLAEQRFSKQETTNLYDGGLAKSVESTVLEFGQPKSTDTGIVFDQISTRKQTTWRKDSAGRFTGDGKNDDRTSITRFVLSTRKSTGELVGFSYSINTNGTPVGGGYEMWARVNSIDSNRFVLERGTMLYDDLDSDDENKKWKARAYEQTLRFLVEEGESTLRIADTGFNVDPKTLKRQPDGEPKIETYEQLPASSSELARPFSANVFNAWQTAGAELGWINPTQLDWIDVVKFYSTEQAEKAELVKSGLLPTMRFKQIDWDVLGELPAPEGEFVIVLDGVDLEGLKFENLTRFTSLVGLDINRAEPTGEQVLQIANLKQLRLLSLNFGFTLIPEEILAKLVDLDGLQFLDIAGVLPSKRITALLPKFSKLRVLRLDLGTYTKSELEPLSGLRDLRALCIGGIDLDETWLSGLENYPKLEYLDLSATKTGRHSLIGFEKLKTLKTLNLVTTKTSDESVDVLKSLTSLRELKLSNCIMSDESEKALKSALRHCKIEF